MTVVRAAIDELEQLANRSTEAYARLLDEMLYELLQPLLDALKLERIERRLADLIGATKRIADLYGRRRTLLETDAIEKTPPKKGAYRLRRAVIAERTAIALSLQYATTPAVVVPRVTFAEAFDDLITREPRLAKSAERVSELYSTEHAFAMARSARLVITERVQKYLAKAIDQGIDVKDASEVIRRMDARNFTRAYAETVYRTNLATAYANGRMEQANDPDLDDMIVAFRRVAVGDADTRDNHAAAHGLVAAKDDPIWRKLGVPAGFNCRCAIELVDAADARASGVMDRAGRIRRARVPAGAYNDPGFQNKMLPSFE